MDYIPFNTALFHSFTDRETASNKNIDLELARVEKRNSSATDSANFIFMRSLEPICTLIFDFSTNISPEFWWK